MSNVRNIHFEAVGSYLRPAELKEARAKFADGKISAIDLRAVEDRLITEVISQQKAHRLPYITDGEFRRSYWHLDFMWGFNGVEHIELEHGYQFHGEETTKGSIQLTGKITGENHPFIKDFLFVKQFEELDANGEYIFEAKQTVPAPAQFLAEKEAEYTKLFANPYNAAKYGYIDDVIEPRNTRFRICRGLAQLATKRQSLPAKKHGCMPM